MAKAQQFTAMGQSQLFIDGAYVLTFVGTTNGVIQCPSFNSLRATLQDTYPNPGDQTLAYMLDASNWLRAATDDMPFHVETLVSDEEEDYRIAAYRVIEIEG